MEVVNLMIEKGASGWHWGLYYACKYRQDEIAKLMSGDQTRSRVADYTKIIESMVEKGAGKCLYCGHSHQSPRLW